VFDCGINQGRGPAVDLLQRSLRVPVDGRLGPKTRAAMQGINDVRQAIDEFAALRMHRYATGGDQRRRGQHPSSVIVRALP
jgi:lysozyme family protein